MQRHISPIAKQRISDFFTQEDGNVGRKNALTAGTILGGAMLAAALFAPGTANAGNNDLCSEWEHVCGQPFDNFTCCSIADDCCEELRGTQWHFYCADECPDD